MGYLFLLLALLSGSVKGYCGKRTSGCVREYKDAMFTNFIRMIFCVVISLALICVQGDAGLLKADIKVILITMLSGVTTSVFVVAWLISVRKGAYMMLDVFLMMGVIVPLLLSSAMFGETIHMNQWIGLAILFVAVLIMCSYNNSIKEKMSIGSVILLIICGAANGLTDFSQKLYVRSVGDSAAVFNFYTYVFSAIVLLVVFGAIKIKDRSGANSEIDVMRKVGIYVLIMSICLFVNSYFKTKAAWAILPSAKLYSAEPGRKPYPVIVYVDDIL